MLTATGWATLEHAYGNAQDVPYAALPVLATIAGRHAPACDVAAPHLAAAIIASEDGPQRAAEVRRDHADDPARPAQRRRSR